MQKSYSSGLTSEELLIRSSSYSVLQNYMPIPTKNLLSPLFGGQGRQKAIKKVPQNIDFVGLVCLLSPFGFSFGDPLGARTQDPNIKSVVLYQLS